ncbi:MAG: cation:proton antiporter [Mycobacteriaceae bacterium]|nr:cation:proton antiporter [Mycobacteriaceae bacterium]MBV9514886.1 cation:proton antiporter [Mycobacteriaceae bacterium]
MTQSLIAIALVVAGWSLFTKRLQRWHLTAPIILVVAGIAMGITMMSSLTLTLNTEVAQRVVQVILAVLLFLDATEVRGGFFGRDPRTSARLLFIALPLSLGLAVLLGRWLLPHLSWAVLAVMACVVVSTDFSSVPGILRDKRLPERIRNLLMVEAGYNDGIISPVFVCFLAVAAGEQHRQTPLEQLSMAIPPVIKALAVGVAVGGALAMLTNAAEQRDLMTAQSKRLLIVVAPILVYGISIGIGGNGFVAAFVCGIAMNAVRRTETFHREMSSADDIGFVLAAVMWFAFGCATVVALKYGITWRTVVFAALALTVVRVVPIFVATVGSRLRWWDRLTLGCLAPRGTPSIVFGLLAYNALEGEAADTTLGTMVLVVLGAIVFHGLGAPTVARLYASAESRSTPQRNVHLGPEPGHTDTAASDHRLGAPRSGDEAEQL